MSERDLPVRVLRLRTRAQFQALLGTRVVARTAHFALHRLSLDLELAPFVSGPHNVHWLGAMVPKRWARRSVTRNTVRRQIYAMGEHLTPPLTTGAYLVRLTAAFSPTLFPSARSRALKQAVRRELQQLFE